jgi:hypothetical protein
VRPRPSGPLACQRPSSRLAHVTETGSERRLACMAGEAVGDEEAALRAEMARVEDESRELAGERRRLGMMLQLAQLTRRRFEEAEEKARKEAEERARQEAEEKARQEEEERERRYVSDSSHVQYVLSLHLHVHLWPPLYVVCRERARLPVFPTGLYYWLSNGRAHDELDALNLQHGRLMDVAITEDGYMALFKDGRHSWYNVPKPLDNKLRGRQAALPLPVHVALGAEGQYVVIFADGSWDARGPQDLYDALGSRDVKRVALGRWGVWCVLYKDGRQSWSAGLPTGLYNQLNSRSPRLPSPVSVGIGPDDEWFVAYSDGKWRAGGLPQAASADCDRATRSGDVVRTILFGADGAYLVACD